MARLFISFDIFAVVIVFGLARPAASSAAAICAGASAKLWARRIAANIAKLRELLTR
jgi:hypothetical protein